MKLMDKVLWGLYCLGFLRTTPHDDALAFD